MSLALAQQILETERANTKKDYEAFIDRLEAFKSEVTSSWQARDKALHMAIHGEPEQPAEQEIVKLSLAPVSASDL